MGNNDAESVESAVRTNHELNDVAPARPPVDLLTDAARFWSLAATLPDPPILEKVPPALKRLGPLPFPRVKFPLMGFLATVYEHVASHVRGKPSDQGIIDP